MELKSLKSELKCLSTLVEGWTDMEEIPVLERDLALGKLRKLYESLRFEGTDSVAAPASEATGPDMLATPIDLGEVLSLDEPVAGYAVDDASECDSEGDASAAGGSAAATLEEDDRVKDDASLPAIADEDNHAASFEPLGTRDSAPAESETTEVETASVESDAVAVKSAPVEPPLSTVSDTPTASVFEPDAAVVPTDGVSDPDLSPSAVSGTDSPSDEPASVPEPDAGSSLDPMVVPHAAPGPIAVPEPASGSVSEPVSVSKSGSAYVTPTLFGLEEATVRHRNRQRIIMSLYDSETPAAEPVSPAGETQPTAPSTHSAEEPSVAESVEPVVFDAAPATNGVSSVPVASDMSSIETTPSVTVIPSERASVPPEETLPAEKPADKTESLSQAAPATGSVLGEVINHDVQTLADTIVPPRDRASELRRSEPVTDLRKAVGINDRFLMIRDLFEGDAAAYETAIEAFNGFSDLDECLIHIAEHYAWNANSDGAKLLMDLLERKFA